MPKLPTVTLRHKRTGKIEKRNRTEYSRNIGRYANNWVLVTEARGDATDAQIRQDARESKLNQYRKENPKEQAWRGDKQRRYEERKISEPIYTSDYDPEADDALTEAVDSMAPSPIQEVIEELQDLVDKAPAYDDTWETMAWFKAAEYVREKTGTRPANKKHARRLMGHPDAFDDE